MHSGSHFVEKNKKYKHRGKKSFRRIYSWPSISEGSTSVNSTNHGLKLNKVNSRARWLTRSRDRDHPGQHGETLSLLKIQKLAGHGGVRL